MTAPFPTFPCGGCSLIPTSSKHTKLGGGLEKLFLPLPMMSCIPSHAVLRETLLPPAPPPFLKRGYRRAELLEEQTH